MYSLCKDAIIASIHRSNRFTPSNYCCHSRGLIDLSSASSPRMIFIHCCHMLCFKCARMLWFSQHREHLLGWQTSSWGHWWRLKYCVGRTHWRFAFCHIRPSLLSNWHKTPANSLLPPSLHPLWMWANTVRPPTNNMYLCMYVCMKTDRHWLVVVSSI